MWKQHKTAIIWSAIVICLLVLPFVYFSNWGQDFVANQCAQNVSEPWAKSWQERVGNTHFYLGRYDKAEKAYSDWMKYWPFNEQAPDPQYQDIYIKWVMSIEENGRKDEAQVHYENFLTWWPDHPKVNEARMGVQRCKNWR